MPDEPTRQVPKVEVREPAAPPADVDADLLDIETQSLFAFLSSVKRAGRWEPADQIDALALLGEVKLDFTRAVLPEGEMVEVRAVAVLGSVKLVVPEGSEVEMDGLPLLGGFEQKTRRRRRTREVVREWVTGEARELPEEPPLFRVTGFALLGSVEVIDG